MHNKQAKYEQGSVSMNSEDWTGQYKNRDKNISWIFKHDIKSKLKIIIYLCTYDRF